MKDLVGLAITKLNDFQKYLFENSVAKENQNFMAENYLLYMAMHTVAMATSYFLSKNVCILASYTIVLLKIY